MVIDFNSIFSRLYDFLFVGGDIGSTASLALFWWGLLATFISVIFVLGIAILLMKFNDLKKQDDLQFVASAEPLPMVEEKNREWDLIKSHLESDNPSDWKLAIIEADKMLDEMMRNMGYPGDNLGERLKAVEPSDFDTLDDAWEAHKIRNQIAHQSGFVLTQREAQRAIQRYERVFKEFNLV